MLKMKLSNDVKAAMRDNKSLVAVESTILTHGLSYPYSFNMVLEIEQKIIDYGAVPVLVAVVDGEIRIGLDRNEMDDLARKEGRRKLSCSDLGVAVSKGWSGGTTAASTAWIAAKHNIRTVLAGGLGGVHREVSATWDISNDLTVLQNSPVLMVCGGVKSFLDIGKSLEMLETLGVPYWSYGSNKFPGYLVKNSPFPALNVATANEVAEMATAHWALGLKTGIVLGVPIPENYAFDHDEIEQVIAQVLQDPNLLGAGKNITPIIIKELEKITKGRSAESNKALIINASQVAAESAQKL